MCNNLLTVPNLGVLLESVFMKSAYYALENRIPLQRSSVRSDTYVEVLNSEQGTLIKILLISGYFRTLKGHNY